MDQIIDSIFFLMTTTLGILVYRGVLVLSILVALLISFRYWKIYRRQSGLRLVGGFGALFGLQMIFLAAAGIGIQRPWEASIYLPVIAWGVSLLSMLFIIWLWTFLEGSVSADISLGSSSIVILVLTALGILWWSAKTPGLYFNGQWADQVFSLVGVVLGVVGGSLIAIRQPVVWKWGFISILIFTIGCVVNRYFHITNYDFAVPVHLAELVVFPLLVILAYRQVADHTDEMDRHLSEPYIFETHYPLNVIDPRIRQAFLSVADEQDNEKFLQDICHTFAVLMMADVCLVAYPLGSEKCLTIPVSYDLVKGHNIGSMILESNQVPVLLSVLNQGRNLYLEAYSSAIDSKSITDALSLPQTGHLLAVSASSDEGQLILGIILITPYSLRAWSAQDQQYLMELTYPLIEILQDRLLKADQVGEELPTDPEKANIVIDQVAPNTLNDNLIDHEVASTYAHDNLREEAAAIGSSPKLTRQPENPVQYQNEVRLLDPNDDELFKQFINREGILPDEQVISAPIDHEIDQNQELVSITQELRRPISSINDLTDILLGDSIGRLDDQQRKYIERMKASTERMSGLLEELYDKIAIDSSGKDQHLTTIDLQSVIDDALALVQLSLNDKKIHLNLDLSDTIPSLLASHDELVKILVGLIENAVEHSPMEGQISIRTRADVKEDQPGFALIHISDSGVGFDPTSLQHLFSQSYSGSQASLEKPDGVDVSLPTIKRLVETIGARIWVDSEKGGGTTYTVLLPFAEADSYQQVNGDQAQ